MVTVDYTIKLDEADKQAAEVNALTEKEKSFEALNGVLAGYEIDLDKEREERVMSRISARYQPW